MWNISAVQENCLQLASALPGQVSFPGSINYVNFRDAFWSTQESTLAPTCVVRPQTTTDVSKAVAIVIQCQDCPFAIKGGGHSPYGGYASIDHGIALEMAGLDSISVTQDRRVASIGAGQTWGPVYEYLDAVGGVAVAGGENGNVGVGGLLIGGGISILGPRVGFSCDNVVNFEIVLADAQIVNANATSNPDLWRALKGGTNNFGIVTRYDLATIEQEGGVWGGSATYGMDKYWDILQAFAKMADAEQYDPFAFFSAEFAFSNHSWTPKTVMSYSKAVHGNAVPVALQPMMDAGPKEQLFLNTNLSTMANEGSAKPTNNILLSTSTYAVDTSLMDFIFRTNDQVMRQMQQICDDIVLWQVVFQPLPSIWTAQAATKGGNSIGADRIEGNSFVTLITVVWKGSHASIMQDAVDTVQSIIDRYAAERDLKRDLVYLNYAGRDQDPLGSYGADEMAQLRRVAAKYDPRGVFQRRVPGGFKLDQAGW